MHITEYSIHKSVIEYLSLIPPANRPLYWHTPNGEYRSKASGAKCKKLGVKPGVPDLFFAEPRIPWAAGLFIELKTAKKGRLSPHQTAILQKLASNGYAVTVCYSLDDVINALNDYLRVENDTSWKIWYKNYHPNFPNVNDVVI